MSVFDPILQALFPARCPGCGAPAADGLCGPCRNGLRPAPPAPAPAGLRWWVCPFAYEGALREMVARLKYRNTRAGLGWLAAAVAGAVRAETGAGPLPLDAVTWPPTTRARARERGFDQAELLARAVARELGLPARRLLARSSGAAQTGRSQADRARGPVFVGRGPVSGARLLVVDDVATTGATLAAAGRALQAAGAAFVVAASAGRTPRRVAA